MTDQYLLSDAAVRPLVEIAVESWRFSRVFNKILLKLDAGEAPRYVNQGRYFYKKIDEVLASCGLKLVSLEGHRYEPGMAVSALNISDFGPDDDLFIEQMVEPIIMGTQGLVRGGTVILGKN